MLCFFFPTYLLCTIVEFFSSFLHFHHPSFFPYSLAKISEDALFALVEPFAAMLAHSRLNALTSRIESGVFNALLYE